MRPYQTVLAVVPAAAEPSAVQPTPAVRRALELARASGATLHLCLFEYDTSVDLTLSRMGPEVAARVRHDIMHEQQAGLQRLAADLAWNGGSIECEAVWAPDPAQAILAKALSIDAQLVVKDAHHESALRRVLYTPLDWKLLRLLPCGLMLVGQHAQARPRRVAAAIDVQAEPEGVDGLNRRVLDAALQVSEYLDARLDLVSVLPVLPPLRHSSWPSMKAMYMEAQTEHYDAFSRFAQAHSIPADRRHRLAGIPVEELRRFVDENHIDLLVVGSVYRRGWEKFLLGSTAEGLAQEIDADLLLVKPADFIEVLDSRLHLDALRKRQEAATA